MSVPLAYWSAGSRDAPVLVLGASLGASHEMWAPQMAALARDFRVVAFDHRGHGASPAPPGPYSLAELGQDVLDLMDGLGVARFGYAGLSLGGMVGMWLGANAPGRINRLVLICTSAHMPPASMWQERAATVRAAGSVEPLADAALERWLTPETRTSNPELRARLRSTLVGTPPEGYASCCEAIERMDLRGDLARVSAPTLVISGADDPSTPPEHQRVIAELIGGARHETLGSAAHMAAAERPEAVNALILEHLR